MTIEEFIELACKDQCIYCKEGYMGFVELHEGKYHTRKGESPTWLNKRCYAEGLRALLLSTVKKHNLGGVSFAE